MEKYCEITTTCKSKIEAKKIAKVLLENKLVACVQISIIESFYSWQKKLVEEKEFLLTIKTKTGFYKKISEIIAKNHSYKIPQIIMLPIKNGSDSYLQWIESVLKNH